MKRSFLPIIVFIIVLTVCIPSPVAAQAEKGSIIQPSVSAPSGILINAKTGEVLWQKNADDRRPMASTTKIMTAILAIENRSLDDTVTVGGDVASVRDNAMKLTTGEQIKLNDLLYALMLNSANDAAVAIADYVDGSLQKFVDRMNAKAKQIGATSTNYLSPNGLMEDHLSAMLHFSTARDLGLIARYAMRNKIFAEIVGTKQRTLARDPTKPVNAENLNKLLWTYPGANGIKTGYTRNAGNCLVASASRGSISLISVILGDESRASVFKDSASLLNYGFSIYENKHLIFKNTVYRTINLRYGQKVRLVAASDSEAIIKRTERTCARIEIRPNIRSPIKKGEKLGKISIFQSGKLVTTSALVADKNVKKPTLMQIIAYYWRQLLDRV